MFSELKFLAYQFDRLLYDAELQLFLKQTVVLDANQMACSLVRARF